MNIFSIAGLSLGICCFALATFVLIIGRSKLHRTWAAFNTVVGIWGLGTFFVGISTTPEQALIAWKFSYSGGIFISVIFYHTICIFCGLQRRKSIIFAYAQGIFFLFLDIFTNTFIHSLDFLFNSFYYNKANFTYYIFFYIWASLVTFTFYEIYKFIKKTKGIKHIQAIYLFWGFLLGFVGGTSTVVPSFGIMVYPAWHFTICIYTIIMTYAIFKHQLMDIKIVIQKGFLYSILVSIITLIYLLFVLIGEKFLQGLVGYKSFFVSLVSATTIALFFIPLRNSIQCFLDRYFFKGTLESLSFEREKLKQDLFQTEKLAYVGQLASSIVHEIKSPLTAIKTYVEYLPQKYSDPKFKAKFQNLIPREIERINNVVNQLLDIAKPRDPKLRNVDIHYIIDSTLSLLENNFKKNNIKIVKNYPADSLLIEGDQEQLRQVFLNLFLNSIDAMPSSGTLTVETKIQDARSSIPDTRKKQASSIENRGSKVVEISVSDTGCGILQENLNKLFTPFFTTKKDGVGLGLVIIQEIISNHRGIIEVKSEEGKGTRFILKFSTLRQN